jgi:hypothetical protein
VACLSTHSPWQVQLIDENTDTEISSKFRDYLEQNLPEPNTKKIYFDYGNLTGDVSKPYQSKIDKIMGNKGYSSAFWQTIFFRESHNGNILGQKIRYSCPISSKTN